MRGAGTGRWAEILLVVVAIIILVPDSMYWLWCPLETRQLNEMIGHCPSYSSRDDGCWRGRQRIELQLTFLELCCICDVIIVHIACTYSRRWGNRRDSSAFFVDRTLPLNVLGLNLRWANVQDVLHRISSFFGGLGPQPCPRFRINLKLWILDTVCRTRWTEDQPV
jgi:hypothetical protein